MSVDGLGVTLAPLAGRLGSFAVTVAASAVLVAEPATAELMVSQLIVEFKPGAARASDIEIVNNSPERAYVQVEPREILNPGSPAERPLTLADPRELGLLVSPTRLILEPQQRRTLRIAAIGAPGGEERVYRVTVKPVTGEVSSSESGLKLMIGYDLLVLQRPTAIKKELKAARNGRELIFTNDGNASVELSEGKQCDGEGRDCQSLPGKRLYAGATWKQMLPRAMGGEYRVRSGDGWSTVKF